MIDTDEPQKQVRSKQKKLRVTFAGQGSICYKRSTDTFIEALKQIPEDKYPLIDLECNHVRLLSRELDAVHKDWQKPLVPGWYVVFQTNTEIKYRQLISIKNLLGLDMNVEIGEDFECISSDLPKTRNLPKLLVELNDSFIGESNPVETYIQTLWAIGIDELKKKDLVLSGMKLITTSKKYNNQIQVGVNRWASFPTSTKDKAKWLNVIAIHMKLKMKVSIFK